MAEAVTAIGRKGPVKGYPIIGKDSPNSPPVRRFKWLAQ